jgi:hypothetical protein
MSPTPLHLAGQLGFVERRVDAVWADDGKPVWPAPLTLKLCELWVGALTLSAHSPHAPTLPARQRPCPTMASRPFMSSGAGPLNFIASAGREAGRGREGTGHLGGLGSNIWCLKEPRADR